MEFAKVLLLVCAAATPRADCRVDTAIDVIAAPPARNEIACGFMSQAYIAETAVARHLGRGEYLKIVCGGDALGRVGSLPGDVRLAAEPSRRF